MKTIDLNETKTWLQNKSLIESDGKLTLHQFKKVASCKIPRDSGKKTVLAKSLAGIFEHDTEALLWINEFGIWPSSEDANLFNGFRKSFGETKPLHEKPGHIFSKDDIKTIISLLAMTFYFCWGAIVLSTGENILFKISHDEIIDIFIDEDKTSSALSEQIKQIIKILEEK